MTMVEITCKCCVLQKPEDQFHLRKETGRRRTTCKQCWRVKTDAWAKANIERRRAISLKWAKANPEYLKNKKTEYRAKDPVRMRKWAIENPEKMKACQDRWYENNKEKKAEHAANRRARMRNAVPSWANRFFVEEAYRLAKLRTQMFGFRWEVDHIVPLAGKLVCGLHVETNLRVIPCTENRVKGHHRWPDMP
jgi:hypothetical protein